VGEVLHVRRDVVAWQIHKLKPVEHTSRLRQPQGTPEPTAR
jgi:hypothetical protein